MANRANSRISALIHSCARIRARKFEEGMILCIEHLTKDSACERTDCALLQLFLVLAAELLGVKA